MTAQHTIRVEFPGEAGGPHTIVVDDTTFRLIRLQLLNEQIRKAEEKANETAERIRNLSGTFTFTTTADAKPAWARDDPDFFDHLFRTTRRPPAPPAQPEPEPAAPRRPDRPWTVGDAIVVIDHYAPHTRTGRQADLRKAIARAKRAAHPDTGGTSADFHLVTAAEEILRSARRI